MKRRLREQGRKMPKIDLSVVILNFNTKEILLDCLRSVFRHTRGISFEVVVVDNGSRDGSVEEIRKGMRRNAKLRLVENEKNLGFAKGNNRARNVVKGKYVLFLNSDTVLAENTLKKSLLYMKRRPEIGALTVRQILPDGRMDRDSYRSFPTPWVALTHFMGLDRLWPKSRLFGRYWCGYLDSRKTQEIEALQGAFFLSPKRVLDEVGWFDEDYFLNGEDIDLSWKIREAGYRNVYLAKTKITHLKGATKGKKRVKGRRSVAERMRYALAGVNAMEIFYKKRLAKDYPFWVTWAVMVGVYLMKAARVVFEIMR